MPSRQNSDLQWMTWRTSHSKKSTTHHTFIKYETMTKVKDNKGGRPKLADYQKRTKLVRIIAAICSIINQVKPMRHDS